jgi:Fur family transcriptional regulator, peroxide stress response regulator
MSLSPQEIDSRMAVFIETCRKRGVKVTHQRMEVFREVASTDEHPDVETIHSRVRKRLPTVSLDTVYRAVTFLEKLNLISRVHGVSDRSRFDGNMQPHHHFVCSQCGLVRDFYSTEADRLDIPAEVRSWGRVDSIHVSVDGICSKCSEAKPKRNAGRNG